MRKTTINCEIRSPHGNYVIDEEEKDVGIESPHSSNPSVGTSRNKEKGKECQLNERSKKRKVQIFSLHGLAWGLNLQSGVR